MYIIEMHCMCVTLYVNIIAISEMRKELIADNIYIVRAIVTSIFHLNLSCLWICNIIARFYNAFNSSFK